MENIIIKFPLVLLALLGSGLCNIGAAPASTNFGSFNRILLIDPSSMPVYPGNAILTIGALRRTGGVYSGEYKIKVSPYFFKSEKGRLAIIVSDASEARINQGKVAKIAGTATTNGKEGKTRHVDATALPADANHGMIKLSFMAGDRKMIFNPAYHFSENLTTSTAGRKGEINLASISPRAKQ